MKVVVTGAAGYLGRHVVALLISTGHEVVAVHRPGTDLSDAANRMPDAAKLLALDLAQESSVAALRAELGPSVGLVHLAALRPDGPTDSSKRGQLFEQNVLGTLRVLEAAGRESGGVSSVVYACDAEVYGGADSERALEEEGRLRPRTDYAACKLSGEDHLFAFEFEAQTRCVSLRFGELYGPGRRRPSRLSSLLSSCARVAASPLNAHPGEIRPRLDVRDAAIAVGLALTSTVNGRFNIADGLSQTLLQEARLVFDIAGCAAQPVFEAPAGTEFVLRLDLTRARSELGFQAKHSLADALSAEWRSLQP